MSYASTWCRDFVLTHDNLKHSVAGASAGIISSMITCPLDVVKTRIQNQGGFERVQLEYKGTLGTLRRIRYEEGFKGLYRGLGPTIAGYLPTWAIYFTVYDYCKLNWAQYLGKEGREWLLHIASAMTAGMSCTTLTNPLWLIRTRFMTQTAQSSYHYKSILDAFITIAQKEGIRGLYKGLGPSLIGASHIAIQFPLYEELKSIIIKREKELNTVNILLASSTTKLIASTITYPHEVIRTRLQMQVAEPFKYKGILHAIKVISQEEGIRGFYRAIPTNLIRTVPASSVSILVYEMILKKIDSMKNN
ncbi:mitochondrial carrier domain-containing protein [Pilobolus umbonatus]|nr:mitochondrial carrier domain-containing protein [Pilobolus umbonatus]